MSATNFHSLLHEYYTAIARFSSNGRACLHGQKNIFPRGQSKRSLEGIYDAGCKQSHARVGAVQQREK
jgi:hypothetical protein